jgi:hypothetical protein
MQNLAHIFGEGCEYCPETGRPYERGSGALSKEAQTANFVRERDRFADMPKHGERCLQTGREFECGRGALTKTRQTELFLRESK